MMEESQIAALEQAWLEKARASLRGADPASLTHHAMEGIAIPPVFSRGQALPLPPRPAPLARGRGWAVVQGIDLPRAGDAAAQGREELQGGADGLSLILRSSPFAAGFGLPVEDLEAALEDLEAELFPLRLDAGAQWFEAASILLRHFRARHYDLSRAPVFLAAAPFAAAEPPCADAARQLRALSAACPECRHAFAADTRLLHALGADDAQQIALAAAQHVAILRILVEAGEEAGRASARIVWLMAADAGQFSTIAAFRAARLVHARILSASGLPPRPLMLHAESAWRMLARRDAWVNMLRLTSCAFAAGIGGADAITLHPFTAPLGLADAFARRMARNAQIIALEEAGLGRVHDAAAGAFFIVSHTRALAERAWEIFRRIEAEGGLERAGTSAMVCSMIARAAAARAAAVARGEMPLTGVSAFPALEEEVPHVLAPTPSGTQAPPRLAEPFEALRDAADAFAAARGARPCLPVFTSGDGAPSARISWLRNMLASGGLRADVRPLPPAAAAPSDGAPAPAVLCAADADLAAHGEAALAALRDAGFSPLWVAGPAAGLPADGELKEGMDVLSFLRRAHRILGVSP